MTQNCKFYVAAKPLKLLNSSNERTFVKIRQFLSGRNLLHQDSAKPRAVSA